MILWFHWWNVVCQLRNACSRTRTFLWFATCIAGFSTRIDLLGVTSIIRELGLKGIFMIRFSIFSMEQELNWINLLLFGLKLYFGSWFRTIRPDLAPSELVTTIAFRNTYPEYLSDTSHNSILKKFLLERIDIDRKEGSRLVA